MRLVLAMGAALGPGPAPPPAPDTPPPTASAQGPDAETPARRKARAKAAVRRAHGFAEAGDFARALTAFEEAMAILPAAKLHHNIAVCHHQLMLAAPADDPARARHRGAAVRAYQTYLDQADAPDRAAIEQVIADLGGPPEGDDGLGLHIERIDPDDDPPPRLKSEDFRRIDPDDAPRDVAAAPGTGAPRSKRRNGPSGLVGVAFAVDLHSPAALTDNPDAQGLPLVGAIVWGGGLVGRRRATAIGAEVSFASGVGGDRSRYRLAGGHLGVFAGYGWSLGRTRRIALGAGGMLGLVGDSLTRRDAPRSEALCPDTSGDANVVSQRGGILVAARARVGVLLGTRRNHEIALRIAPALGLFNAGSKGDTSATCESDGAATPFQQFGMDEGASLVVITDLGYAARF